MPRSRGRNAALRGPNVSGIQMRTSIKAVALVATAVLSLSACAMPTPSITVFSASNSVHESANCWAADCQQAQISGSAAPLAVTPGRVMGISVDSEIADAGWQPAIVVNGQAQVLEQRVIHKRYWRMTLPESTRGSFPKNGLTLEIVSKKSADGLLGVWLFRLTDAETTNNA